MDKSREVPIKYAINFILFFQHHFSKERDHKSWQPEKAVFQGGRLPPVLGNDITNEIYVKAWSIPIAVNKQKSHCLLGAY